MLSIRIQSLGKTRMRRVDKGDIEELVRLKEQTRQRELSRTSAEEPDQQQTQMQIQQQ